MHFKRHRDDEWFDEIRLETETGPILRLVTVPRYKTSGLSGDEWRTSGQIQYMTDDGWAPFDRAVMNLEAATMALYPGLYTSHPALHNVVTTSIDFYRKGRLEYRSTYDDQVLPLIHAAGHLPWATVLAGENVIAAYEWEKWCFQPGCPNLAVSTYQIIKEYSRWGDEIPQPLPEPYHRRFCKRHLQRGNAGLEDADSNYIVIDGPGPDEAEGWGEDESEAVFGGVIDLR